MNVVLATYYGTAPAHTLGQHDVSEPVALRKLWNLTRQGQLKVSGLHPNQRPVDLLKTLGGAEQAQQKLSEARPWLKAWDEGERQGVIEAHVAMKSVYDEERLKHSAPAPSRRDLLRTV
jgi:hypothetical protein